MPRGDGTPRRGSGQAGPTGAGPGTGRGMGGAGMGRGQGRGRMGGSRLRQGYGGQVGLGAGGSCVCPSCGASMTRAR